MIVHGRVDFYVKMSGTAIIRFLLPSQARNCLGRFFNPFSSISNPKNYHESRKEEVLKMKRKMMTVVLTMAMTAAMVTGCGNAADAVVQSTGGTVYKVGIVQYVDDASLNQIEKAIETELDAKGTELGVTFDYANYTHNGQADSTVLNQIAADLIADEVDIIIPIATPAAMVIQNATSDVTTADGGMIPVVFSAVSDPVGAGLVADNQTPGTNITGTSDAIDTEGIMKLIVTANPETDKIGLLYDKSQPSSEGSIADAKAYCDANGITYVEKTGTTTAEVQAAADSLVAEGVDAIFTPQDNTIMTAELAIFEKFTEAGIPHYTGADSFALNGAFCGYGVNYAKLGTATADMAVEILVNGAEPATTAVKTLEDGIITVNTETAEAIGLDYTVLKELGSELVEITTAAGF